MLLARTMERRTGERQTRIRLIRRRFLACPCVSRDAHEPPLHRRRVLGAVAADVLGTRGLAAALAVLRPAKAGPAEQKARTASPASDLEALHEESARSSLSGSTSPAARGSRASVARAALRPARSIGGRSANSGPSPTRSRDRHRRQHARARFRHGRVGAGDPGGRGPVRDRWRHSRVVSRSRVLTRMWSSASRPSLAWPMRKRSSP